MSKSLGTGIGLNDSADNMFGKVMAIADEGVIQTFIDCTRLRMAEIEKKNKRLKGGENPKDVKLELAHEITEMYHGAESADKAENLWKKTFSDRETPKDLPEIKPKKYDIVDVLVESGICESKSEARRAIEQCGVKVNDAVVSNPKMVLKAGDVIKKGKRFFVKVS